MQPRRESSRLLERVNRTVRREERVLERVMGIGFVAHDAANRRQESRCEAPNNALEGLGAASLQPFDERLLLLECMIGKRFWHER
jgi:predicted methyltransferase